MAKTNRLANSFYPQTIWALEWRSISVQEASLQSLVRIQAVSHLAVIESPIEHRCTSLRLIDSLCSPISHVQPF